MSFLSKSGGDWGIEQHPLWGRTPVGGDSYGNDNRLEMVPYPGGGLSGPWGGGPPIGRQGFPNSFVPPGLNNDNRLEMVPYPGGGLSGPWGGGPPVGRQGIWQPTDWSFWDSGPPGGRQAPVPPGLDNNKMIALLGSILSGGLMSGVPGGQGGAPALSAPALSEPGEYTPPSPPPPSRPPAPSRAPTGSFGRNVVGTSAPYGSGDPSRHPAVNADRSNYYEQPQGGYGPKDPNRAMFTPDAYGQSVWGSRPGSNDPNPYEDDPRSLHKRPGLTQYPSRVQSGGERARIPGPYTGTNKPLWTYKKGRPTALNSLDVFYTKPGTTWRSPQVPGESGLPTWKPRGAF